MGKKKSRIRKSRVRNSKRKNLTTESKKRKLILDMFSSLDLRRWRSFGSDVDRYHYDFFYSLESQRAANHDKIIESLSEVDGINFDKSNCARVVDYEFSSNPLSSVGSLRHVGGRFNIGSRVDPGRFNPFPALYLASDEQTARLEKFPEPINKNSKLKPEEYALSNKKSHTIVFVECRLTNVFDLTKTKNLNNLVNTMKKFEIPKGVHEKAKDIGLGVPRLVKNSKELLNTIMMEDWRYLPAQHSLPSNSQILGNLLQAADFSGVLYKSTKGKGKCLAVFPKTFDKSDSYIRIEDKAPKEVNVELNSKTWKKLSSFEE